MKVVTNQQHYYDIAEVIREKTGITTPLKPAEMAPALADMVPADQLPHAEEFTFGANLALPEVPASVLATHPKAVIFMVTSQESTQFVYIAAASTFYRVAGELLGMEYDEIVGSLGEGVKASDSGTGTWGDQFPVTAGTAGLMIGTEGGSTYSLVWANHDIYEVLDIDAATGTITTGAVYFAASNTTVTGTADDYRIQNETLDSLGEEVNRLCNTVEPMAPERMTEKLQNLDITLEEIIVTPSTEVQEIRPGAYGFSKVIVEAVENSGTGGGGTGEGGDDTDPEETYVSSDNLTFGVEYSEQEVPTGFSDYITENGSATYPNYPNLVGDVYAVISSNYSPNRLYTSPQPFVVNDGSYNCPDSTGKKQTIISRYDLAKDDNGNRYWSYVGLVDGVNISKVYWSSHNILNRLTGAVSKQAGTIKKHMEVKTAAVPLDRPDTYTISGDNLNSIVSLTQTITGKQENMTPSDAIAALEKYAEDLAAGAVDGTT